jgi:hypothetical protein
MTCPSCRGNHTGPVPCRKCRGTGRITPAEPQRPAWLQTRDLRCSCGRSLAEHERPCMSAGIRAGSIPYLTVTSERINAEGFTSREA